MDGNKPKEGMSVKEIEEFAKRYRFEVFFCLMFVLACIFGIAGYFRMGWNIFFGMAGGILGVIFPNKVEHLIKVIFKFVFDQDKIVQIVLGVVGLLIAIFFPFLIFLKVGAIAGRTMHQMAMDASSKK
jgi:hypothetical protein